MFTEVPPAPQDSAELHERIRELEEQVAFYQSVLNALPDPLFLKDENHRVIFVNEAHCQLVGLSPDAILATNIVDPTPEDEQAVFWAQDRLALNAEQPIENEEYLTDSQGNCHVLSTRKVGHRLPSGKKILIGTVRDITQRRELEAQLQHEQALLRQLFDSIPDLIFYKNLKNEYVGCNRAFEVLVGRREAELIGKQTADLLPEVVHDEFAWQDQKVLSEKCTLRVEQPVVYPDGRTVVLDTMLMPFWLPAGEAAGLLGISRDITKHKANEEELRRAKDAAESANRTKSQFLSTITHELRTPMNGVLGLSSLLMETDLSDEQHDLVAAIHSSGNTLLTLINDILDFSKIEANGVELEYHSFDLQHTIETVFDLVAAQATAKGLTLAYLIDPLLPPAVVHDETRLRQILINLLGNAVKFSDQGEIVVTVEGKPLPVEEDQIQSGTLWQLCFTVQDSGIGIRKERMHRLFHPFSQLDSGINRRYGGTGLGLAISKRLVELMGGTMWVESEVGQGSHFHFTIEAQSSPGHHRAWAVPTPILLGRRALVIEQSASIQRLLKQQLTAWGINVSIHRDFDMRLLKAKYDLLIISLPAEHSNVGYRNSPGTPLDTMIQAVRRMAPNLPILFLTPLGGRPNLGPDLGHEHRIASVPKPIHASHLHDALVNIISGKPHAARRATTDYVIDKELANRKPLHILLAEDNIVNQKVVRGILAAHGYRCDIAADGIEVLDALKRQPYDVIFMDLHMPELDGIVTTELIRSSWPDTQQPHIIALTANALTEDSERCLAAGMNDFISKPIQMKEFVQAIERVPTSSCDAPMPTPNAGMYVETYPEKTKANSFAPIDLTLLSEIAAAAGNQRDELFNELITLFLESTPPLLSALNTHIGENDLAAVRKLAHTLRSPASQLGAQQLVDLCKELEMLPAADGYHKGQELARQIMSEYQRVESALQQTLLESATGEAELV